MSGEPTCPRRALMLGAGLSALAAACTPTQPEAAPVPTGGQGRLAKVGDVPIGGGLVTSDGVLVMQLTAGAFTAVNGICPHQNWRLSPPDATGVITCTAHLSRFKATDGALIDGPAPEGLKSVPVQVKDGYVVKITV